MRKIIGLLVLIMMMGMTGALAENELQQVYGQVEAVEKSGEIMIRSPEHGPFMVLLQPEGENLLPGGQAVEGAFVEVAFSGINEQTTPATLFATQVRPAHVACLVMDVVSGGTNLVQVSGYGMMAMDVELPQTVDAQRLVGQYIYFAPEGSADGTIRVREFTVAGNAFGVITELQEDHLLLQTDDGKTFRVHYGEETSMHKTFAQGEYVDVFYVSIDEDTSPATVDALSICIPNG